MGPFTLLDFVGLDTTLFIADAVFAETKDTRFARRRSCDGWSARDTWARRAGRAFTSTASNLPAMRRAWKCIAHRQMER